MSEELKPCPFCGSTDIDILAYEEEYHTRRVANCINCGASGSVSDSVEEAIESWNARPIENVKDKEIVRLKGNWDYLKEYLVALRNSRLHDENLLPSEMNRHGILFLDQLIEKMNAADNNVGSIKE